MVVRSEIISSVVSPVTFSDCEVSGRGWVSFMAEWTRAWLRDSFPWQTLFPSQP